MPRARVVAYLLVALLAVSPVHAFGGSGGGRETPGASAGGNLWVEPEPGPPGGGEVFNRPPEPAGTEDPFREEESPHAISDPLEPVNRALFVFNDKAYFWVMKPVAQGYRAVVPEGVRLSVRNFFSNLAMPIRFVNNLLQGKIRNCGTELARFAINTTAGIGGLFDPAGNDFHIKPREEDLGQTFGRYGLGHGFYIVLPLLGPSSLRDAAGMAGDFFLDPINYAGDREVVIGANVLKAENELSLRIGEYEDLKKSSIDPYVAVRDAYSQYRARKVGE